MVWKMRGNEKDGIISNRDDEEEEEEEEDRRLR
jgi:hypothetical protein